MQLEGIHHITAITGDGARNVEFYVGTLGLRMVKKTVNQDDPSVPHLFYGDEHGSPGNDLTFFVYRDAPPGRAGDGMVHRIVWRVGSPAALDFWRTRLQDAGTPAARDGDRLRFADPEGLEHELVVSDAPDPPLVARSPEVPPEHALQGFDGVRACAAAPERSAPLLDRVLGFTRREAGAWEVRGTERGGTFAYDPPPEEPHIRGAGTVHHVAFASRQEEQESWQELLQQVGMRPTPVIDRFYFRSVYFREPSGVLFEIATMGPGFAVDEDAEHLGERLSLPPGLEPLRAQLEPVLPPLPVPRAARAGGA